MLRIYEIWIESRSDWENFPNPSILAKYLFYILKKSHVISPLVVWFITE